MTIVDKYLELRPYLWTVAYNMTGEIHEAEDLVQDGFEVISRMKEEDVTNAKAYFTRIIINKSIDRLKELKKQRTSYPGPWLPAPHIIDDDEPTNENLLPYAMLHMSEKLNPMERAVFVLREAFSYSYADVAAFCDISEANCRQLLHRAKAKVRKGKHIANIDSNKNKALLDAFLKAALDDNHEDLKSLLQQDIKLYSDGGGKVVAARNVIEGPANVSSFFIGITRKSNSSWREPILVHINNDLGILIFKDGLPYLVMDICMTEGKIDRIFLVRNPDKISLHNLSQNSNSADI